MPGAKKNTQVSGSWTIFDCGDVVDSQGSKLFFSGCIDASEIVDDVDEEHEFLKYWERVTGEGEGEIACEWDDFVPEDIGEDGFVEAWQAVWVDRGLQDAVCASVGSVSDQLSELLTITTSYRDESED
eukprot:TRINITY_DN11536_c0_g2_i1.p1 TRINITY_DN11536_c0_g2~~TRINITY_DN11536_c0_g2_i1.p1  ORF type:complete len:149 (-),score=34.13 TRINITY_DN11536_c0_g2_i1:44-427(-)